MFLPWIKFLWRLPLENWGRRSLENQDNTHVQVAGKHWLYEVFMWQVWHKFRYHSSSTTVSFLLASPFVISLSGAHLRNVLFVLLAWKAFVPEYTSFHIWHAFFLWTNCFFVHLWCSTRSSFSRCHVPEGTLIWAYIVFWNAVGVCLCMSVFYAHPSPWVCASYSPHFCRYLSCVHGISNIVSFSSLIRALHGFTHMSAFRFLPQQNLTAVISHNHHI